MHKATLATGIKRFNEIPFTSAKPSRYRINELITLVHSVVHTYHPEKTEPKNVVYQDMKQINNSFEINHILLY